MTHVEEFEQALDPLIQFGAVKPVQPAEEFEYFTWSEAMIEAHVSGEKSDLPANLLRFLVDVMTSDVCSPSGGLQDRREHAQGSRFPGPVRAEQTEDFAIVRFE